MKKKLLIGAMMTISVMAFARVQAVWTSTCGVKHYTSFPDSWTYNQMASWIESMNYNECGTEVDVTIHP